MSHLIVSLEQSLRIWEDLCFAINLFVRTQNREKIKPDYHLYGPFVHFAEFRNYLLKSYHDFDRNEFSQKFLEDRFGDQPLVLKDMAELPFELALWSYSSRRVYHLKSDMCYLLNATSIKNMRWKNIKLPFDSFAVILDEPIISENLDEKYDCVLVSSHNTLGLTILSIRLINAKVKDYRSIPTEEKKHMQKLFKNKKSLKLLAKLKKHIKAIPDPLILPHFELPLSPDILEAKVNDSIIDLILNYVKQQNQLGRKIHIPDKACIMPEEGNTAARLLVSLCLFLTTKQAKNIRSYNYQQPAKKQNKQIRTITHGSEIFKVTLGQVLTPKEKQNCSSGLKKESGYTIDPHWRQGFFRFPPNKANNPIAKKTVWVSPTYVNAHLVPIGQLPNGAKIKIKNS